MSINAHRALYSANSGDNYLGNLTVAESERVELRGVRDTIREALRGGFAHWGSYVGKQRLFDSVALEAYSDEDPVLRPKFRMQGSWSYHTLNQVTYDPPQEIDLDDGVFLPVSFLSQNGETHPSLVAIAYFEAVESILQPICDENEWTLEGKPSCVRVSVREGAHVDLALYAIPDEDFRVLVEKVDARALESFVVCDAEMTFEQVYQTLPEDHIVLAHRIEGWKPSDPRKLEDWFQQAVKDHGEQIRRICRYLKGWRDFHWEESRLSSIALMAVVVAAFNEAATAPPQNRDDLALEMVAEGLAARLSSAIANPVVDGQFLDEGWDKAGCRSDFVAKARLLARDIKAALNADTCAASLRLLRTALGDNIPDDAGLLNIMVDQSPTILTQGMLGETRPESRSAVKIGGEPRYG